MPAVAGPGLGHYGDYWNPNTRRIQNQPTYQAPKPQPAPQQQSNVQSAQNIVQSQQDSFNAQIESDYNNAMGLLNSQEQGLRGQADTASRTIDTQAADTRSQIQSSQTSAQGGVSQSLQKSEKEGASAIQQARDLYRQTQQANNAQLSALGISSSSVSEALAERLGVETARRIGGISGSLQEIRTNASNELNRINQYYTTQLDTLSKNVEVQKSQIQNSLIQGINQINGARNQAASDKAAARANLLNQVQAQLGQLAQQQQQFEQSLQQWAAQKSAALTPIAQDPNYVQNLLAQTQQIQQGFNPSQFVATPTFNVDKYGNYTGQIGLQKPNKQEEEDPIDAMIRRLTEQPGA